VVAAVKVGAIRRLVLALEEPGGEGGNAAEHLPVGIDDVPVTGR
jgi:hypothetical protein